SAFADQCADDVLRTICGSFAGRMVLPAAELVGKLKAAVDARVDRNLLIVARTDASAVHGTDDAIERAHRYAAAGADVLFIEAMDTPEDVERLPALFDTPQLINIVIGGKTPTRSRDELARLGYGVVLYANAALQGAVHGMQAALTELRDTGRLDENPALVAPF
ncbi:carboxyvinyl-carboxyphosphonate phosphorylmutase, partial [Pseudomonas sp. MWU13-2625]